MNLQAFLDEGFDAFHTDGFAVVVCARSRLLREG